MIPHIFKKAEPAVVVPSVVAKLDEEIFKNSSLLMLSPEPCSNMELYALCALDPDTIKIDPLVNRVDVLADDLLPGNKEESLIVLRRLIQKLSRYRLMSVHGINTIQCLEQSLSTLRPLSYRQLICSRLAMRAVRKERWREGFRMLVDCVSDYHHQLTRLISPAEFILYSNLIHEIGMGIGDEYTCGDFKVSELDMFGFEDACMD